ncbi:MAG: NADH-quinone oxidoreductase subunit C [Actinomycetota bacterium]
MSDTVTAPDDVASEIRSRLGEAALEVAESHGQLIVRVPASERAGSLAVLKTLGFDFYSFCCGVDWPDDEKLEVLDHVYSLARRARVTLKCEVPRSNPRVETAVTVYAGADWHERETWELFGIVFAGHPRLRRLLLADWQEGFPMRKDEVLRARIEKPWPGDFFSG